MGFSVSVYFGPYMSCVGKTDTKTIWDYTEKIDEALYSPNLSRLEVENHIYLPNKNRNQPREFSVDCDRSQDSYLEEIKILDIEKEKQWFIDAFKSEYEKAMEIYGKENVQVSWGKILTIS